MKDNKTDIADENAIIIDTDPELGITYFQFIQLLKDTGIINVSNPGYVPFKDVAHIIEVLLPEANIDASELTEAMVLKEDLDK